MPVLRMRRSCCRRPRGSRRAGAADLTSADRSAVRTRAAAGTSSRVRFGPAKILGKYATNSAVLPSCCFGWRRPT